MNNNNQMKFKRIVYKMNANIGNLSRPLKTKE